ncbi:uncharacterized protein LOC106460211 [Limulus polyphemus]|uniref:Uncharacterized protein LOC106460211 n=1 Tax=Limulus polyphemus TaxID=6850 RepID=A0ABM1SG30_LIMPO|nr:uncharacterized protein LOC106460211 [Limulus polyphemus]XP_022242585.1 uncharacterized protein LOC106460211 [Limulus polyphemus]
MRVCAAGSCKSNSELNLGLLFHPLPKDDFVKDQWIDLLDIDDSKISDQTRVCSLHFKSKDYGTVKRNLKASALPSLYLSKEKSVPAVDVFDNTGEYDDIEGKKGENNSESDKQSSDKDTHQVTTETKKEEEKPVRRASRKAALLAAEKIQRAVREYGLLEGVRSETPEPEPKKDSTVKLSLSKALKVELIKKQQLNMTPTMLPSKNIIRPITVGYSHAEQNALYMECFEEVLSPVQVAACRQAQQEYDKVMKYILSRRASKNEKVKIIYTSHEGEVLSIGQVGDSGNRITTSPLTGGGKNIPTSIVTRPLALEGPQNAKPSSVQTMSGENSSSKLLVDTTTGVIMGSLPKDITILQPSTGQNKTTVTEAAQRSVMTPKQDVGSGQLEKPPQLHTTLIQGSSKAISAHSLMDIKPRPLAQVNPYKVKESIDKLKKKLAEEECFQEPVFWLVSLKMLPDNPLCLACTKSSLDLVPDSESIDGYIWKCGNQRCCKKSQIVRPNFFGRFGIPLAKLLQLTYHWAVQSDLQNILDEVNVDVYMARSVWRALQEVCARALVLKSKKLGGPGTTVEISFAYMGRFSILGAYDRESGKVRMKAISSAMGWSASVYIRSLEPWLLPSSVIVSSEERLKDISKAGHTFLVATGASSTQEGERSVWNIKNYLHVQLNAMFGSFIVAHLKLETVQGYLDEIQWRERFGTCPNDAFWNIVTEIGEQNGNKISSIGLETKQNQLPENVITLIGEKNDLKYRREYKGQVKRPAESPVQKASPPTPPPPLPKKSKPDETVYVILSEYYYAKQEGDSEAIEKESKENINFKCHFCKKLIENNIKLMKHMNCHIENTRQKNPDLSDLTQCKYCFRDFETPFSMQCHVDAVHMKTDTLTCQICNQAFSSRGTLTAHMKALHVECEMPYICKACGFRSSMHQQVLEHFEQVHNGSDKLLCHYCLKVFSARLSPVQKTGMTQNFFLHLQKHQLKSQSRKCPACCLVFVNYNHIKTHRAVDHVSMAEAHGVIRMKCEKSEKDVVVKDPHVKTVKMSKSKISPVTKEVSSFSQPSVMFKTSEEKYMNIVFVDDTSHLHCIECKGSVDGEHFRKFMSCSQCGYATNCGKAFVNHMVVHNSISSKKRSSLINLKPIYCQGPMFCICGYNTINGNDIAQHLVVCGKRSCYPSRAKALAATIKQEPDSIRLQPQSAFFPPLVVLDANEEESINESFARVQTWRSTTSENEVSSEPKDNVSPPEKVSSVPKPESSNEQPLHMLNVLGLVRKPPSTAGKEKKSRCSKSALSETASMGTESKESTPKDSEKPSLGVESDIDSPDNEGERKENETNIKTEEAPVIVFNYSGIEAKDLQLPATNKAEKVTPVSVMNTNSPDLLEVNPDMHTDSKRQEILTTEMKNLSDITERELENITATDMNAFRREKELTEHFSTCDPDEVGLNSFVDVDTGEKGGKELSNVSIKENNT